MTSKACQDYFLIEYPQHRVSLCNERNIVEQISFYTSSSSSLSTFTAFLILNGVLTLFLIMTLSGTSTADDFRKHCDKREIAHNQIFNWLWFFMFCQDVFKIICCRFGESGKGWIHLSSIQIYHIVLDCWGAPHITHLQQTILKTSRVKHGQLL